MVYMASDTYGGASNLKEMRGGGLQSFFGNCPDKYMDGHCWKKVYLKGAGNLYRYFPPNIF